MASRIPTAWRIGAGKSTTTGCLNFNHVTKSTPAWPPRLRLGSSGTAPLARSLFHRQQHQQRRSFGGFNFLFSRVSSCHLSTTRSLLHFMDGQALFKHWHPHFVSPPNTCCWLTLLHGRKKKSSVKKKDSSLACVCGPVGPAHCHVVYLHVSLEPRIIMAWLGKGVDSQCKHLRPRLSKDGFDHDLCPYSGSRI